MPSRSRNGMSALSSSEPYSSASYMCTRLAKWEDEPSRTCNTSSAVPCVYVCVMGCVCVWVCALFVCVHVCVFLFNGVRALVSVCACVCVSV